LSARAHVPPVYHSRSQSGARRASEGMAFTICVPPLASVAGAAQSPQRSSAGPVLRGDAGAAADCREVVRRAIWPT
jgi:hypothetical protein